MTDLSRIVTRAIEEARRSTCRKSKRGVVFWHPSFPALLYSGHNGPPRLFEEPGAMCPEFCQQRGDCNKHATHAEVNALAAFHLDRANHATPSPELAKLKSSMLHVKVDEDGNLVHSGGPSCAPCATLLTVFRVDTFWLFHAREFDHQTSYDSCVEVEGYDGIFAEYTMDNFWCLSMEANSLPVIW